MTKGLATERGALPTADWAGTGVEHYAYLASAIAGRKVTVQWANKRGDLAYSDGQSIFLPLQARDTEADPWAAIAAQAALIGAGSLQASILRQLVGRQAVTRRYLYLEILRAARLLKERLPWAFTERPELRAAPHSVSARDSLEAAATRRPLPEPPAYFGRIEPLLAVRSAFSERALNALSTVDAAEPEDHDEGESSKLLRLFQNPLASRNPVSKLLNDILGAGGSKRIRETESGDSGAELPVGRIDRPRALQRGIHAVLSSFLPQVPSLEMAPARPAFIYPEWDVHAQTYHRNWVFVEEAEAWREDGPQDMAGTIGAAPAGLRHQLSGLGVDQEMHRRENEGSDLDPGALVECAIELRAGHSPSSLNIYRSSRRTRRDLAITLVVDISGSTGEPLLDGSSIFKKQLTIAHQLGFVLNSLGDAVAMFGFHSWGRKLVRVVRIKGYEERWTLRVAERMALLEPVGYTRIGTAIRHGTHLLHDVMRLPNRLLVLVTDGIAYDQDYELNYAAADAAKALAEARDAGTACVCLSVGGGHTQNLIEIFGAANILAVDEVAQVPGRIRQVCRHALASVSKRRFGGG